MVVLFRSLHVTMITNVYQLILWQYICHSSGRVRVECPGGLLLVPRPPYITPATLSVAGVVSRRSVVWLWCTDTMHNAYCAWTQSCAATFLLPRPDGGSWPWLVSAAPLRDSWPREDVTAAWHWSSDIVTRWSLSTAPPWLRQCTFIIWFALTIDNWEISSKM